MKKALFTMAIVLLAVAAQAQNTAIKVHSDGQISLQSATTSGGIQIPTSGIVTFHPNLTAVIFAEQIMGSQTFRKRGSPLGQQLLRARQRERLRLWQLPNLFPK